MAFWALLLDAYRELNSRRLFWIVLGLSALFVIVYASIGFTDRGMFILFGLKHFDSELLRAGSPMAGLLYRGIFASFVVPIWLAWIATILALISTASIFPEFVSGGSIDLLLCKPITRLKLFLSKYVASLLFVILQVSLFCVGVFLAMGWRIGDWEPRVFAAIPLVTLFYSYLYSFCVLIGIWTRSTLAALLLTMLMWVSIFSINAVEEIVVAIRSQFQVQVEEMDRALAVAPDDRLQVERDKHQAVVQNLDRWLHRVRVLRWPLPKTSETVELLDRMLAREGDINIMDLLQGRIAVDPEGNPVKMTRHDDERAQDRAIAEADRDSPWFIISTSLLFEAVMLALAAWIFCRRDF